MSPRLTPRVDPGDAVLARMFGNVWPALPALAIESAAVCAGLVLANVLAPGINPVSIAAAALTSGPCAAALAGTAREMVADGDPGVRSAWRVARRDAGKAIAAMTVPAVCLVLFVAALRVWEVHRSSLLIPSLGLTGAAAAFAVVTAGAVIVLGEMKAELSALARWRLAAALLACYPSRFLAPIAFGATGVWVATRWTASVLLLFPAPTMLVLAAAVWTAAAGHESAAQPE